MARNRSSLAIGNVVGSVIANIIGAFSLGLLFHRNPTGDLFEKSSTIYTVALLIVTGLASALLAFGHRIDWRAAGGSFLGLFIVYLASISYLIAKGITKAPEDLSDSDPDSDDSDEDDCEGADGAEDGDQEVREIRSSRRIQSTRSNRHIQSAPSNDRSPVGRTDFDGQIVLATLMEQQVTMSIGKARDTSEVGDVSGPSVHQNSAQGDNSRDTTMTPIEAVADAEETTPASRRGRQTSGHGPSLERSSTRSSTTTAATGRRSRVRGVAYHLGMLGIGFIAVLLSGYVLSNAASNLVDEFGISDVLAGVVILSIATTIPEKFIAVLSGYKGHMDIMLANTVGSNMFLLTLCIGIIWTVTGGAYEGGDIVPAEIAVMFGSTVVLAFTVLLQGRFSRIIGLAMLMGYVAFIALEFTVIHKV